MIVCKQCGNHNPEGDTFCGSCGAFLEWVGERVETPKPSQPEPEPSLPAPTPGLMTRIKHAVVGDDAAVLPPPGAPTAPGSLGGLDAPPVPGNPGSGGFATPAAPSDRGPGAAAMSPSPPLLPPPGAAGSGSASPGDAEAERRRRDEEEARRRAAALLAQPRPPQPTQPAPALPGPRPASGVPMGPTTAPGPSIPVTSRGPASPLVGAPGEPVEPGPAAQLPGEAKSRPKPQSKQAPSQAVNPGDLVCGECGEGNTPTRKFCRRCGASLADVAPVGRPGLFKRLFHRTPAPTTVLEAGARPQRGGGGGRGRDAARAGRRAKGGVLGGLAGARRVLALLALVGIGGGLVIPSARGAVMNKASDVLDAVKRRIHPTYVQVNPNQARSSASSVTDGHGAELVVDGARNTYWVASETDATPSVSAQFTPATSIEYVLVTPGAQEKPEQFKASARPKDLFITLLDGDGKTLASKQVTMDDKADFQKFTVHGSNVVTAQVTVQSCYPDPQVKICAISELEFFKKK